MDYIPVVAWGIKYGGTAAQRANYFGSWGLLGDAPAPSAASIYAIPYHPFIPTIPTFGRLCILVGLLILGWRS